MVERVDDAIDLLNDCLDQIYDYFGDKMHFDEDTIVEFLRSNGYDVNEAIDYIMEFCGQDEPPVLAPSIVPRVSYSVPQSGHCIRFIHFQTRLHPLLGNRLLKPMLLLFLFKRTSLQWKKICYRVSDGLLG